MREITAEVQQPAARPVVGIAQDPIVHVAIWPDHGRRGAVIDHRGIIAPPVPGVFEGDPHRHPGRRLLEGKRRGVQTNEVTIRAGTSTRHDHIQGVLVMTQGRGRLVGHTGDVGIPS